MEIKGMKGELVAVDDAQFEQFSAAYPLPDFLTPEQRLAEIDRDARWMRMRSGYRLDESESLRQASENLDELDAIMSRIIELRFLDTLRKGDQ